MRSFRLLTVLSSPVIAERLFPRGFLEPPHEVVEDALSVALTGSCAAELSFENRLNADHEHDAGRLHAYR
jgi:hypothetical protein